VENVSPTQLNVLLPVDTPTGSVQLQTESFGLTSTQVSVHVQAVAPALFMQSDGKHVVAIHAEGSLIAPGGTTGASPAHYRALPLATPPTITFNSTAGQVLFSSLIYTGPFQINVTIPSSAPGGDVAVVAQVGSTTSPSTAVIAVQ
jgi:hypothetical protein